MIQFDTQFEFDAESDARAFMANCEECGKEIPSDYALCVTCEKRINGTVDGIPVNDEGFGLRTTVDIE